MLALPRIPRPLLTLAVVMAAVGCREATPSTAAVTPAASATVTAPVTAHPGELGVERPLAPGDTHLYPVDLAAGELVRFEVLQRGVDLYLVLLDPADRVLLRVDSPNGSKGSEHLVHIVEAGGRHTLSVRGAGSRTGTYVAREAARRQPAAGDHLRVAAEAAVAGAYASASGLDGLPPAGDQRVTDGYARAVEGFRTLGDRRREADVLYLLGHQHLRHGRPAQAVTAFERLLRLLEPTRAEARADAHNEIAVAYGRLGQGQRELEHLRQALALYETLGDRRDLAATLHNLGRAEARHGRLQRGLELLRRAARLWRQLAERAQLVETLNALGSVHRTLGDLELALDHQRRALALTDGRTDPVGRVETLCFLGATQLAAGDVDGAAASFEEALPLSATTGDAMDRALVATGLGRVAEQRGHLRRAREHYRGAREVFARRELVNYEATLLVNLGNVALRAAEPREAHELYTRALVIFTASGHREGEAGARLGLARAERELGRLGAALDQAEEALATLEGTLGPGADAELVLPFFSSRQDYFDLVVELLMEHHRREPEAGYDGLALAAAEQARARQFLRLLGDDSRSGGGPRAEGGRTGPPDGGGRERRRALRHAIESSDRALRRLGTTVPAVFGAALQRDLRHRLAEYRRLSDDARAGDPWRTALERPRPLVLPEIQRLLAEDSLLLEIHLGEEASYLWVVWRHGLESHRLPGRASLEPLARRASELLQKSDRITHRVPAERAMRELSELLLAPVGQRLAGRRLLVVPSGALELVPFAALPSPLAPGELLVDRHEVVHLPSTSVLAALRGRHPSRPPAKLLALVTDPVFGADDPRLEEARPPGRREPGELALGRLLHTRREAQAILAAAGDARPVLHAEGFDAHRELVTGGALADYRIVHFATHGVLHDVHPELSALVLSRYHPDGRPRSGRLALYDVHDLRLAADLVVLSACRTALGKQVRGEGLLGLPRGFLLAGASQVLVSLWRVQDEGTAELMARFYRHLLVDGRPVAEALRRAQASMRAEARYAPYHWAGFVLQGDPALAVVPPPPR
ncbi:MAG TPA: CHAT domain-containing tetratricopeptide repeat protein [Thermoanaerobaculia bacterium]|nr:CHAT domain-containing tetratricopeptide repeat protein [Thermoanaerobaculia bacterium]